MTSAVAGTVKLEMQISCRGSCCCEEDLELQLKLFYYCWFLHSWILSTTVRLTDHRTGVAIPR